MDPLPAENYPAAFEPIGIFDFHIGNLFSGGCQNASDRPIAGGLPALSPQELTQYGIGTLNAFSTARKTALINEYNALSPADQAGTPGQNLKTRIAHLGGDVGLGVAAQAGTLSAGWTNKEEYVGIVNANVQFNPHNSSVLTYLAGYGAFMFFGKFFNYHSDEQCGQVHGNLAADPSSGIPPLQTGVYNIQSREAVPFSALNASQMTPANIDAVLAAGSVAEKVVVTVSGSLNRLVVSKAVITNPMDPPANWTITSRGESLIGRFLPAASVVPRDLFFQILPPNDQENVLGSCEGTAFAPAPDLGFARLYAEGNVWKLLLHAGTNGADGVTYKGDWSGATATIPTGCTPADLEILTPTINFGNVEDGMTMYREIVMLNRSAGPITVNLPVVIAAPFGAPGAMSVVVPVGSTATLLVSFTAGPPGVSGPTVITLTSNPVVVGSLDVTLTGTSVAVQTVDVVMVLDRSGSMSDAALSGFRFATKTEVRNQAGQAMVELLRPGDRIGMVRFNQDAQQHMPLEVAGPEGCAMACGRATATTALASVDLNPSGATSVGDGMIEANTMLTPPSTAARKAMVVLTDGIENRAAFISSVVLGAGIGAYAIGFGKPQDVNVDKLSAITGNTGGYLLITGDLDADNEYRLHKYFLQILAGISADQIVVDPRAYITPGETQRTPFYITEADTQFDAVLLTRFPPLGFTLEAPDGTRIDPANAASFNGQYVLGRESRYYRMKMPVFAGNLRRAFGKWHVVVRYPGRRLPPLTVAFDRPTPTPGRVGAVSAKVLATSAIDARRGYNVLVRARSAIQLDATIEQSGFGPLDPRMLVAHVRGFGLPLFQNLNVFAQAARPDGVPLMIPMQHAGNGRFEAKLDGLRQYGSHQITVRVAGLTPGNLPLQREQTVTAAVVDPVAQNEPDIKQQEILDELKQQGQKIEKLLTDILNKPQPPIVVSGLPGWLIWAVLYFILLLLMIIWLLVR
jgi:hypothetical protein